MRGIEVTRLIQGPSGESRGMSRESGGYTGCLNAGPGSGHRMTGGWVGTTVTNVNGGRVVGGTVTNVNGGSVCRVVGGTVVGVVVGGSV
ncbi:hypothetical protein, partial [Methanoculleus sp.]|uniref:hypothetical protein n=1 Tax=Methanoculleus sp. TaxID=90427 RepID=UPI0026136D71